MRVQDRLSAYIDERGELVFGPARPHPSEIIGHLAWRYRNELAPYYTAAGLGMVGETGYVYAPTLWPLALPIGAGVVAVCWRWLTNRRPERVYALAVGIAATVWTAAVWWASWDTGWFFWTAVVGATAAGIPRWWHYRRRAAGSPSGLARREGHAASCGGR
jgi:hypothetical protein